MAPNSQHPTDEPETTLTDAATVWDVIDADHLETSLVRRFEDMSEGDWIAISLTSELAGGSGYVAGRITEARKVGHDIRFETPDGKSLRGYYDRASPIIEYINTENGEREYATARANETYVVTVADDEDTDATDRSTDLTRFDTGDLLSVYYQPDPSQPAQTLTGYVHTKYNGNKILLETPNGRTFTIDGTDTHRQENVTNSYTNHSHGRFMYAEPGATNPKPLTGVAPNPKANAGLETDGGTDTDEDTDATDPWPDRDDLRLEDRHPANRTRYIDAKGPDGHDMALVTRLNDDGTPKRRKGYDSHGRYTTVDNTTYKCVRCGVETGTSPHAAGVDCEPDEDTDADGPFILEGDPVEYKGYTGEVVRVWYTDEGTKRVAVESGEAGHTWYVNAQDVTLTDRTDRWDHLAHSEPDADSGRGIETDGGTDEDTDATDLPPEATTSLTLHEMVEGTDAQKYYDAGYDLVGAEWLADGVKLVWEDANTEPDRGRGIETDGGTDEPTADPELTKGYTSDEIAQKRESGFDTFTGDRYPNAAEREAFPAVRHGMKRIATAKRRAGWASDGPEPVTVRWRTRNAGESAKFNIEVTETNDFNVDLFLHILYSHKHPLAVTSVTTHYSDLHLEAYMFDDATEEVARWHRDATEGMGEETIELPSHIPDDAEYDIDDAGDGEIVVQWWEQEPDTDADRGRGIETDGGTDTVECPDCGAFIEPEPDPEDDPEDDWNALKDRIESLESMGHPTCDVCMDMPAGKRPGYWPNPVTIHVDVHGDTLADRLAVKTCDTHRDATTLGTHAVTAEPYYKRDTKNRYGYTVTAIEQK